MADEEAAGQIEINGKVYDLPQDYTLREAMIFERLTGKAMSEIDLNSASAVGALVFIVLRREDPTMREDVLDLINLDAIQPAESKNGDGGDERPPEVAGPETEEIPAASGPQN